MIRLFRKIRHKLLAENSYSLYLLYAGGEILLVVIGILIALQIDNWNDKRKQQLTEIGYLSALRREFVQNLDAANESIQSYSSMLSFTETLLDYMGPAEVHISEKKASILLASSMMDADKYIPSPGVLENLISSGNLSKIRNSELQEMLSEWLIILNNTARTEEEAFQHRSDLLDLLVVHVPFANIARDIGFTKMVKALPDGSNFPGDVREIFNVKVFEGRMILYGATLWSLQTNSYVDIKHQSEKIISAINEELSDNTQKKQ